MSRVAAAIAAPMRSSSPAIARRSSSTTTAPSGINTFYLSDDGPSFANGRITKWALVNGSWTLVDTVTAELMIESTQRLARKHVVVFVTLRDAVLHGIADAPPTSFGRVAESVIAHDFLRDRMTVFERLGRLGVHCLDVPSRSMPIG